MSHWAYFSEILKEKQWALNSQFFTFCNNPLSCCRCIPKKVSEYVCVCVCVYVIDYIEDYLYFFVNEII